MELYQVFEKAVNIIETRGWLQGNCTMLGDKPVCAAIAIRSALYAGCNSSGFPTIPTVHTPLYSEAIHILANTISPFATFVTEENIYDWNDAAGRTKEEVTATLLSLATLCKAGMTPKPTAKFGRSVQVGYDTPNAPSPESVNFQNDSISIWVDFAEEFKDVAIPLSIDYYDMSFKPVGPVVLHTPAEEAKRGSIGSAAPPREVPELAGVY